MTAIVVTDLHLDERPANEYRWGILEWLKNQVKEHQANYVLILGDVTDKPDGHSAQMTNRLADGLADLADAAARGLVWLEGNHDCVSEDTEVMTKRGWLHIDDLQQSDLVVGLDTETGKPCWQAIQKILRKLSDQVWGASAQGYDIRCTANHRVLTIRKGKYYYNTPATVPACHKIIHAVKMQNSGVDLTDDEIKMAAWILTDGSINEWGYVSLWQSKHVEEIKDLIDRLGLAPRHTIRNRGITEIVGRKLLKSPLPQHEWHFHAEESRRIRGRLSLDPHRLMPLWVFDMNPAQAEIFITTVILADGHSYKTRKTALVAIHKDERFLSMMQGVASLHGWRAIVKKNVRGHFVLNLSRRTVSGGDGGTGGLKFKPVVITKPAPVWCLSVPTENFMVRRNGRVFLTGNCKDPATPFFRFVRHHPRIRYVIEARSLGLKLFGDQTTKTLWLPHTRDPQRDLDGWPCREYDYLFLHVTVDGAAGENGTLLSSPVSRNAFKDVKRFAISGDIHTPQKLGKFIYVGSPYHCHFGDPYRGRALLIEDDGNIVDLYPDFPKLHSITITKAADLKSIKVAKGDQAKIKVSLARSAAGDWSKLREAIRGWADGAKVALASEKLSLVDDVSPGKAAAVDGARTPTEILEDFVVREKLKPWLADLGRSILKKAADRGDGDDAG